MFDEQIGWYTRRIGLASVMKTSEVYMLQDKSPNFENTWTFLKNRLDEGEIILKFLNDSEQQTKRITRTLGSAFETVISNNRIIIDIYDKLKIIYTLNLQARNIIGLNCDKK